MGTELSRAGTETSSEPPVRVPGEPLGRLFIRFLRFGALAWGGPVAQIAMIRQELVEEERWITRDQFNRALAVYQVLPGPEAHELCVYFGMLSRGRIGGALAGLGFMLPGFLLMCALSWAYVGFGLTAAAVVAVFATMQAAVAALIVRAEHRIGSHVVTDRWLWGIATAAASAQLVGIHFAIILATGGLLYAAAKRAKLRAGVFRHRCLYVWSGGVPCDQWHSACRTACGHGRPFIPRVPSPSRVPAMPAPRGTRHALSYSEQGAEVQSRSHVRRAIRDAISEDERCERS